MELLPALTRFCWWETACRSEKSTEIQVKENEIMLPEARMRRAGFIVLMVLVVAGTIFFGFLVSQAGYSTLREWRSIRAGLSACGALWALAGPTMIVAGFWVLMSLGRRPTPLWLAGVASIVAGGALVVGVLAHVVPCSGPSLMRSSLTSGGGVVLIGLLAMVRARKC